MKIALVGILGLIGIYLRYLLFHWFEGRAYTLSIETILANLIGCLIIGIVYQYNQMRGGSFLDLSFALTVGFCGGLTTFSSYCIHFISLYEKGHLLLAIGFIALLPLAGVLTALLGGFAVNLALR